MWKNGRANAGQVGHPLVGRRWRLENYPRPFLVVRQQANMFEILDVVTGSRLIPRDLLEQVHAAGHLIEIAGPVN